MGGKSSWRQRRTLVSGVTGTVIGTPRISFVMGRAVTGEWLLGSGKVPAICGGVAVPLEPATHRKRA